MTTENPVTEAALPQISTSNEPRIIRINNHGKIRTWVAKSLEFLQETPDRPLVFHTLPFAGSSDGVKDASGKKPNAQPSAPAPDPAKQAHNTTNSVPRLISVVEIIKREYMAHLDATRATRIEGLHQYNELCFLEDNAEKSTENDENGEGGEDKNVEKRAREIAAALNGKNFMKQKQTPYLRITLSLQELPELVKEGATYQRPSKRKISKAAKKKQKAKAKAVQGT